MPPDEERQKGEPDEISYGEPTVNKYAPYFHTSLFSRIEPSITRRLFTISGKFG